MRVIDLVLLTGLVYSAVGALVMYLSHRSLHRGASHLAAYPRHSEALRLQEHDGRHGLIILMCGNVLLLVAACGYTVSPQYWRYPSATLVGVMVLYGIWRFLAQAAAPIAANGVPQTLEARVKRGEGARRAFQTRRSSILRDADAALRNEAHRQKVRDEAQPPINRNVVSVDYAWECRWWSDRFGVAQDKLRDAVACVGPVVADVERWLTLSGNLVDSRRLPARGLSLPAPSR